MTPEPLKVGKVHINRSCRASSVQKESEGEYGRGKRSKPLLTQKNNTGGKVLRIRVSATTKILRPARSASTGKTQLRLATHYRDKQPERARCSKRTLEALIIDL